MNSTINDRIKEVRVFEKLSQRDFGARIGISDAAVSKIESGSNNPSDRTLLLICEKFNIDYAWLKEGVGEMRPKPTEEGDTLSMVADVLLAGNEKAARLFRAFARLDASEWDALEKVIDAISRNYQ